MKKNQFLLFAVFVGIQSFLLQLVDQMIGTHLTVGGHSGFVFIAFQSWALYFLLGSSLHGAVKGVCGYALGIVFALVMMVFSSMFYWTGMFAIPLAALIVVPFMMYFEFAPWCMSNVAAFFVGAGAFFGINNYVAGVKIIEAAFIVMIYCVLGLISGWTSVSVRNWMEEKLEKKKNVAEEKEIHEQAGQVN